MRMENDGVVFKIEPWEEFGKETEEVNVTLIDIEKGAEIEVLFTKPEVDQIVDALYGSLGLEVIPLRDELIAFAQFYSPETKFDDAVYIVDAYLDSLENKTPADDGEFL